MRLDGDMYESTWESLAYLYPKLSIGGYVIVDDVGAVTSCQKAVEEFRATHHIDEPMRQVDWTGIYWQRTK
jgi:hypothetical protein